MSTRAFVLIETAVGKTRDVANGLKSVEGVHSVDIVTGPYDVIAMMEAPEIGDIGDLINDQVHFISGVMRTVTCVAVGT